MTAQSLAQKLGGRRSGGQYVAPCPAHDDRTPSLGIAERDGRVLVKCYAGCDQRDVVEALKARGAWDDQPSGGSAWMPLPWRPDARYCVEWGSPVCEYIYRDANGSVLYAVVRFSNPKTFRQLDLTTGKWKKHPKQVLYRLPEVLEAPIVFVVEGEKDVETLRSWGFVATTNAGGAKAPWLPEYTETLRGREVILIPDNDRPGWMHAKAVATALLGTAAEIRVLKLDAHDVTEWFERGHAELELITLVEGDHVGSV